ncbi:hypothetical protein VB779_10915 [Haloarculaceae archaeon H-GB11]|nr:hypothetical protein [Haloarculaceae archaeon H-GB11]
MLEGEVVTTEITETTVVREEIVATEEIESKLVDLEQVQSRITDAELLDWEVVESDWEFDVEAQEEMIGRDVTVGGEENRVDYDAVEFTTMVDGHCTTEIEESWLVRRVLDELAVIESAVTDVDVEEHDTVESDSLETTVSTEDVQRTIFESDALDVGADQISTDVELIETEQVDDHRFESHLTQREVIEDTVDVRRQLRFEFAESELLGTETVDTEIIDTDIVEIDHEAAAVEMTEREGVATTTETAETTETDVTHTGEYAFTQEDEGRSVVSQDGDKVGKIDHVEGHVAYVEPHSGIVERIESALGWGEAEEEYRLDSSQVVEIDGRGRVVVSPLAEEKIEEHEDESR